MFQWFLNLFRPLPDKNAPRIKELFSFLIEDHGFSFATENLGDAVDRDGKFFYYGPLRGYFIYNEHLCINILYLEQRQEYTIYITDSYKSDQVYIRNGMMVEDSDASYPDRFAQALKVSVEERGEICGRRFRSILKSFEERTPDVEVLFEFNGVRKTPVRSGYRPAHGVREDYLTTGVHQYFGVSEVPSDGSAQGTITFITPEAYPGCLWIGKRIAIQEGARVVGYATVENILNPDLEQK